MATSIQASRGQCEAQPEAAYAMAEGLRDVQCGMKKEASDCCSEAASSIVLEPELELPRAANRSVIVALCASTSMTAGMAGYFVGKAACQIPRTLE